MSGNNKQELNLDEMNQVAGGKFLKKKGGVCKHKNSVRTGNKRDKSILYFINFKKYEYNCPDCGKTYWD